MHSILAYLNHLLFATNQHGVHSPFVYDYVTKCLYSKQKLSKKKSINTFLKSLVYFEVKTLLLPREAVALEKVMLQEFPELQLDMTPFDMLYKDASNQKNIGELGTNEHKMHNGTVIFVDNIHKTKAAESAWKAFKYNEKVTVTIDLFYCGIIFFRKEQAKEHFKIRI